MPIKFCKKCDSALKIIDKNNKKYFFCEKCDLLQEYNKKDGMFITKNPKREKLGKGTAENNPKIGYDFKCPKCGNDKCKVVDLGIMIGDEDWIYLLSCTNCDYAERIGEMS